MKHYLNTVLLVLIIIGGIVHWISFSNDFAQLGGQLEHLDEEVDEAVTLIKRQQARADFPTASELDSGAIASVVGPDSVDLGVIEKTSGIVETEFTIANNGSDDLVLGELVTSCGCTTAQVSSTVIEPGKEAVVTVFFDPDFHEEPQGTFSRMTYVPTNDPNNEELELTIHVELKE